MVDFHLKERLTPNSCSTSINCAKMSGQNALQLPKKQMKQRNQLRDHGRSSIHHRLNITLLPQGVNCRIVDNQTPISDPCIGVPSVCIKLSQRLTPSKDSQTLEASQKDSNRRERSKTAQEPCHHVTWDAPGLLLALTTWSAFSQLASCSHNLVPRSNQPEDLPPMIAGLQQQKRLKKRGRRRRLKD